MTALGTVRFLLLEVPTRNSAVYRRADHSGTKNKDPCMHADKCCSEIRGILELHYNYYQSLIVLIGIVCSRVRHIPKVKLPRGLDGTNEGTVH